MDNQPPNNLEAERSLLGAIILNERVHESVTKIITQRSFYGIPHQIIYGTLIAMTTEGQPIDLVTLSNRLATNNQLETVGGTSYLVDLASSAFMKVNVDDYAKIIQQKYLYRQLMSIADRLKTNAEKESDDVTGLLVRTERALEEVEKLNTAGTKLTGDVEIDLEIERLQQEIDRIKDPEKKSEQMSRLNEMLKTYSGEDKLISSHDLIDVIRNEKPQAKMFTSFNGLDELIGGFRPGQLVSISAVAKSGKTNFCMELTSKQREYNPVWFPFEEGARELISKFLDRGEMPPIFFTPQSTSLRTLRFIELKILEAKSKFNSQIFYIDNLDWIVDPRSQDHERMIQHACMELKRIATQLEVCIVLIAHVRKLLSPTEQPSYNDIKGSSSVYQLSDTVIILWREAKKENGELIVTNNVNVSVQLNRKTGKTGNIKFVFENGHYREFDWHTKDRELEEAFNFN